MSSKPIKEFHIFDRIVSLRQKMGDKQLFNKLAELDESIRDSNTAAIDIVGTICEVVGCQDITQHDTKWQHDDKKKHAISFSIVILRDYLGMTFIDMPSIFFLHRTYFYKLYSFVKKLNPENRIDKQVLFVYDKAISTLKEKKLIPNDPKKADNGQEK